MVGGYWSASRLSGRCWNSANNHTKKRSCGFKFPSGRYLERYELDHKPCNTVACNTLCSKQPVIRCIPVCMQSSFPSPLPTDPTVLFKKCSSTNSFDEAIKNKSDAQMCAQFLAVSLSIFPIVAVRLWAYSKLNDSKWDYFGPNCVKRFSALSSAQKDDLELLILFFSFLPLS